MANVKDQLYEELVGAGIAPEEAEKAATFILERGYRKEINAAWLKDRTYPGDNKTVFICSACKKWYAARRANVREEMFYMRYCPWCGAKMNNAYVRKDKQS